MFEMSGRDSVKQQPLIVPKKIIEITEFDFMLKVFLLSKTSIL